MTHNKPKIRLVQLIRGFDIGGENGGSDLFGIELTRNLDRSKFELAVCAFFRHNTLTEARWLEILSSEGIQAHFLTSQTGKGRLSTIWLSIQNLRKFLLEWRADLCNSHCQLGTVAAIWMKATGILPHAVRTAHGWLEWDPSWTGWILDKIFSGWLFPIWLDAEVGVSQASVDRLEKHWGARLLGRQPTLIYNAIPLKTKPGSEIALKSQLNQIIIGSVGRLSLQKGYRFLIAAMPEIIKVFPQLTLWLIGDGELRDELERQCESLGIQSQVIFLGKRNDVLDLLRQMDLFVLPSLWEGLPTVVMESMSQGIPVVATDIPGTREIVEDRKSGWLVKPCDPSVLAKAVIQALNNPVERLRVSQEALKVVDRFSINSVSLQYQELYQKIING